MAGTVGELTGGCATQQELEIPRARFGLDDVERGSLPLSFEQIEIGELQVPVKQTQPADSRFQGRNVGERLDAGARIFVNDHVVKSEAGRSEQIQVDLANLDLAAEPARERPLHRRAEEVEGQIRSRDGDRRHQREQLYGAADGHGRDSSRWRYAAGSSTSVRMPGSSTST